MIFYCELNLRKGAEAKGNDVNNLWPGEHVKIFSIILFF